MTTQEVCAAIERETGQAVRVETKVDDLDVDSLEFLNLLLTLSEEFGKEIPHDTADHLFTVGDIVSALA
jgi:acyl carrier protein